jgi:hypothetical protein
MAERGRLRSRRLLRLRLDDPPGDVAGFGFPAHMIADFEFYRHQRVLL